MKPIGPQNKTRETTGTHDVCSTTKYYLTFILLENVDRVSFNICDLSARKYQRSKIKYFNFQKCGIYNHTQE